MLNDRNNVTVTQHPVTQNYEEFKTLCGKNAAYKDWFNKQRPTDQLPRGRFFKGKMAGRPRFVFDEAAQFSSRN